MWKTKLDDISETGERSQSIPEVAEWAHRELGFEADAAQTRVLNTRSKRVMLNCTRQWGKSTVTAARALHQACTEAGSLTIAVSPSARQTGEFLRKVEEFARRLRMRVKGDGHNEMSLALGNGSRIVGLPGNETTARGFSAVALLMVDEAARVNDDLYKALRPMLAVSGGALWLMSTPCGKRGFFYEEWTHGGAGWERVQVPAEECTRIGREFLEEERRRLGARWYGQEYGCQFAESESGVFDREAVESAFTSEIEPLKI